MPPATSCSTLLTALRHGSSGAAPQARPDVVRDGIRHSSRIAMLDDVEVRSAGLGEDSPLIGAAELALAPLLANPTGSPLEASG